MSMLFQVKVVSQSVYNTQMVDLRVKGNIGTLSNTLSREKIEPGDQQYLPTIREKIHAGNQ